MTKEIKALPDKGLDLDLKFEVRAQTKRLPYKMKIQAWDMELPCTSCISTAERIYYLTIRVIRQSRLTKAGNLKYRYEINFKSASQIVQDYLSCRLS